MTSPSLAPPPSRALAPVDPTWPEPLDGAAYHGLAGRIVRTIEPHTEADSAALLVQVLVAFGNLLNRGPHFLAEADRHPLNLYAVMVGVSAKGRKGSSWGQVRRILQAVDPDWAEQRVQSGLSSGEGLIWAVRDPIERQQAVKEQGQPTGEYRAVVVDPGIQDKRLLVLEPELASTLRVMGREGNTLSAVIRQAWDSGDLRALTKSSPARASGAHISIVGHITRDELRQYLNHTEAGNGFGNRFLWIAVQRSKVLPEGGRLDQADLAPLIGELRTVAEQARAAGELRRDEAARALWRAVYPTLSEGRPGLLGAMIARAEAQVMRLACLYALLDRARLVEPEHLKAALAVWDYAEASARWIFGSALGDPLADDILKELREHPEGLTRTEIGDLLGRNKSGSQLGRALGVLAEYNLARHLREDTEGRPRERWFATRMGALLV